MDDRQTEYPLLEPGLFLESPGVLMDVRSPSEYRKGHIPGALSLPLFDDEERALIGTLYKQKGRGDAVRKGLQLVGPRMAELVDRATALADGQPIRLYCWRGGMRSGSVAWLLRTAGLHVRVLQGGYKAYRQNAAERMAAIPNLLVLQGATGTGKTAILRELTHLGEQVLDLEQLASHRGSAFGALGMGEQPETQQFQNEIENVLRGLDASRRIWVEGESKSIGCCYLPDTFWERMQQADVLEVEVPAEVRVERLVAEYGHFEQEQLDACIGRLKRRLGGLRTQQAREMLAQGDLAGVAALLLDYYDDAYRFGRKTLHPLSKADTLRLSIAGIDPANDAKHILSYVNDLWQTKSFRQTTESPTPIPHP